MGRKRRDGRASKRGNSAPSSNATRNSGGGGLQRTVTGIRYAGGTYNGQLKGGKPYGRGRLDWDHGDIYEGEWEEGLHHGTGTYKWKDGDVYDGEWKDDKKHGRGEYKYKDGKVYEGQWVEGQKHGWGTMTWPSGCVHEGQWANGKAQGRGTMTSPSGTMYEGLWAEGDPHGEGTKTLPTGEIYEGIWVKGERVKRKLRSQRSQQRRLERGDTARQMCEYCGADDWQYKLQVCSGCNLALYCSAACQQAASRSHRRICDIVSKLPSRDSDRLALKYDKDKMVDLDAGLHYAAKYMDKMKHLTIDALEMKRGDSAKLSTKHLSSLLKSKKGALDSLFLLSDGRYPEVHGIVECDAVWRELHGLKQLLLEYMKSDVQSLSDIIGLQKDTLVVLGLPFLDIDWHKSKSRKSIAMAVCSCKHLVKLDLFGCVLMDSDLKVMLQDLPNLRVLNLARDTAVSHEFTDNTCGLIARKCPGLQELNLYDQNQLSVRGIRKIFEGCSHLRSFYTTARKLSCNDVQSLLSVAPQLMFLALHDNVDISPGDLDEVIEATGGRTVFRLRSGDHCYKPGGAVTSTKTRDRYEHQMGVIRNIWSRQNDPEVANEWAGMLEG